MQWSMELVISDLNKVLIPLPRPKEESWSHQPTISWKWSLSSWSVPTPTGKKGAGTTSPSTCTVSWRLSRARPTAVSTLSPLWATSSWDASTQPTAPRGISSSKMRKTPWKKSACNFVPTLDSPKISTFLLKSSKPHCSHGTWAKLWAKLTCMNPQNLPPKTTVPI